MERRRSLNLMKFLRGISTTLLLFLAGTGSLNAEEIGIGVLNGTVATEAAFLNAQPGTLAQEGETWNFITPTAAAKTSATGLKTVRGTATQASISFNNPGYCFSNGTFAADKNRDYLLMDSWAGIRGTENVVISQLP